MEYTFKWFINNYSYCLEKNGEALYSPEFYVFGQQKTAWRVGLYPRGVDIENKGNISLFLKRCEIEGVPEDISVRYELSLQAADGSAFSPKEFQHTFQNGHVYVCVSFMHMHELLREHRATLLPNDILCVNCKIRFGDGDINKEVKCSARTIIGKEDVGFFHIFQFCEMINPNSKRYYRFGFSEQDGRMRCKIKLDDIASLDGRLAVEIASTSTNRILSACNLFLVGANRSVTGCGGEDNRQDDSRKEISRILLSLTKRNILDRKEEFCRNDKLTLFYKCSFSTGVKYENIENIEYRRRP